LKDGVVCDFGESRFELHSSTRRLKSHDTPHPFGSTVTWVAIERIVRSGIGLTSQVRVDGRGSIVFASALAVSIYEECVVSTKSMMTLRSLFPVKSLALVAFASLSLAAPALTTNAAEAVAVKPIDAAVEWFAAEEAGQIEVKFIPKDATEATILLKNLTKKPLTIKLPEAFAAVPILAQGMMGGMGGMGGGGMGGMGGGMGGGGMGGGGGQGMGGGMGGMGGGGMGGGGMGGMGGGMGGMMRVAPEKQHKLKVTTVCLEHGKPDPNPKMAYKMIPAEKFTQDARVVGICKMLGYGMVAQNTAQAAAWHITDNMSWQQLAAKNRVESKYTGNVPFFSPFEIRQASAVVAEATVRYEASASDGLTGKDSSYDGN
jgi:hypothetical protein